MTTKRNSVGEGLLAAILEEPFNDVPRLVYADWLEEQGAVSGEAAPVERAEFIRKQCALGRLPAGDPLRPVLEKREAELLSAHGDRWRQPVGAGAADWPFWRGFVFPLVEMTAEEFVASDHAGLAQCPLWRASLRDPAACPKSLAASPHLRRVARLHLWSDRAAGDAGVGPDVVSDLAASGQAVHVRHLSLSGSAAGDEGVRVLVASPLLERLTQLHLGAVGVTDDGVGLLAASPKVRHLEALSLRDNPRLGDAGVAALAASEHLRGLRVLDLAGNRQLRDPAAAALAASPHLGGLAELNLLGVPVGGEARMALEQRFGGAVLLRAR